MRTKTPQQAEKILDVAGRLFGTQRFHEVRMDDIATEAGVGKGTLYRYFKDKEELYLALLKRASEQFMARLQEESARVEGTRAKLEAVVGAIIAYFDEYPHMLDLIQRAELMRPSGTEFPWQQTRTELTKLTSGLFKEGNDRGEFTVSDPDLAMLLLLGGLRGVIRFGERPRPGDLARRIVDSFLNGSGEQPQRQRGSLGIPATATS